MSDSIRIEAHGMTYHVYPTGDGGWDVRDAAGTRPVGLRADGPWRTAEDAGAAVRAMTPEEAAA